MKWTSHSIGTIKDIQWKQPHPYELDKMSKAPTPALEIYISLFDADVPAPDKSILANMQLQNVPTLPKDDNKWQQKAFNIWWTLKNSNKKANTTSGLFGGSCGSHWPFLTSLVLQRGAEGGKELSYKSLLQFYSWQGQPAAVLLSTSSLAPVYNKSLMMLKS